jgi:hypothetical protein
MKKLVLLFAFAGLFFSCENFFGNSDTETIRYQTNAPVFMLAAEFRSSVKVTDEPRPMSDYGKICFYNGYLYISEPEKGIHIVDNRNPARPEVVGFIEIMGNEDIAIRNDRLFANSSIDLVWFDISNPAKPELKGRLENIFPDALPPTGNDYGIDWAACFSETRKGVIVGWKVEERVEVVKIPKGELVYNDIAASGGASGGGSGVNGSMSRFGLYQDYLYTVTGSNLMSIFSLAGDAPVKEAEQYLSGNIETLFSYKDKMFMGTPTGLVIYSVENPLKPEYCSSIWHVYGCDPVVVEDDLAYVTVRSGNFCGQSNNELFIMDVSDVYHPRQLVSYTMKNPKGLGIDNGKLFLCDDGLKVFKTGDPQTLISNQIAHYQGMDGFDVIPFNDVLMMIADNGLYQYDYSDINDIKELSILPLKNK